MSNCTSYFPDDVTNKCIRCGGSQSDHTELPHMAVNDDKAQIRRPTVAELEGILARPDIAAPCETCKGDMAVCEHVPLQKCEKARRGSEPFSNSNVAAHLRAVADDPASDLYDNEKLWLREAASVFEGMDTLYSAAPSSVSAPRPCTCHPDDNPPVPCPQKFAINECREAVRHQWDSDGERCVKCGDKDWMAGPVCSPPSHVATPQCTCAGFYSENGLCPVHGPMVSHARRSPDDPVRLTIQELQSGGRVTHRSSVAPSSIDTPKCCYGWPMKPSCVEGCPHATEEAKKMLMHRLSYPSVAPSAIGTTVWIDVKERLPVIGQRCLTIRMSCNFPHNTIAIREYCGLQAKLNQTGTSDQPGARPAWGAELNRTYYNYIPETWGVDFWMPLPSAPISTTDGTAEGK